MVEKIEAVEGLGVSVEGAVATITLDVPGRRNAISQVMWAALPGVLAGLGGRPELRMIVVRGAGGHLPPPPRGPGPRAHFAAGADISEFERTWATRESAAAYAALMAGTMAAFLACPKPVVAAIQGNCIGGAVAICLCCDLCFADETAHFAVTPGKLGFAYSFADTRRLAARVGAAGARDLLFSARRIEAAEALRMGLIDRVCAAGGLDAELAGYAALLAGTSAASVRVAKDFVARAVGGQVAEDEGSRAAYLDILDGPDFAEGKAAFLGKRKVRFYEN
jgi:enoyl-CoA hydratase/carnithine racemase